MVACADVSSLHSDPDTGVVCGLVLLGVGVAKAFTGLHLVHPFDASTYIGVDSGAKPVAFNLYTDFIALLPQVKGPWHDTTIISTSCGEMPCIRRTICRPVSSS